MKRKHYVLLIVVLFICLIALVVGIGVSKKKQSIASQDDIGQLEKDNNEGIMEDEIFEENNMENDIPNNKESSVIPENEKDDFVDNKENGSETENSDTGGTEGSINDSEPPINDDVELPRVPLN